MAEAKLSKRDAFRLMVEVLKDNEEQPLDETLDDYSYTRLGCMKASNVAERLYVAMGAVLDKTNEPLTEEEVSALMAASDLAHWYVIVALSPPHDIFSRPHRRTEAEAWPDEGRLIELMISHSEQILRLLTRDRAMFRSIARLLDGDPPKDAHNRIDRGYAFDHIISGIDESAYSITASEVTTLMKVHDLSHLYRHDSKQNKGVNAPGWIAGVLVEERKSLAYAMIEQAEKVFRLLVRGHY